MENKNLDLIINMSRQDLYNEAKELTREIGENLNNITRRWTGSTTNYWRGEVDRLRRNIRNRERNYNQALRISQEINEPLQLVNRLRGTSYEDWRREVRRLQMRARRAPTRIRRLNVVREIEPILRPVLAQIPQGLRNLRENIPKTQRLNLGRTAGVVLRPILSQIPQGLANMRTNRPIRNSALIERLIIEEKFQELLNMIVSRRFVLTLPQARRFYDAIYGSGRYIMYIDYARTHVIVTINTTTYDFLIRILTKGLIVKEAHEVYVSDAIKTIDFKEITKLTLEKLPDIDEDARRQRILERKEQKEKEIKERREERKKTKEEEKKEKLRKKEEEKANRKKGIKKLNRNGGFFHYLNTTNLDLKKYQIFNQDDVYYKKVGKNLENCLIHTLKECGIDDIKLNSIKLYFQSQFNIKRKYLSHIANIINSNITIHQIDNSGKLRKQTFKVELPTPTEENVDIALYEDHYFKFEKTKYSSFFIKNYEELKYIPFNPEDIISYNNNNNNNYIRNNTNKISSLILVDTLFKNDYFQKLDMSHFSEYQQVKQHIYLENIENEQKLVVNPNILIIEKEPITNIWFADCETFVSSGKHELQLIGFVDIKSDNVSILDVCNKKYKDNTLSLVNDFLDNLIKKGECICYFHNLKYDYFILEKYLTIINKCEKDNQLYSATVIHKKIKIEFRDSYKLLPFSLSKFQTEFNLPKEICKKEAISYEYYTKENHNQRIDIDEYVKLLSIKEKQIFREQIKNEYSYDAKTNTFNPLDYYKEYLRLDCLVLKSGLLKFRELISQITENKMDIFECLTISSLTDKYMIKEGVYKDVYKITGNLREYVSRAVMGGRVAVNEKYQKQVIEEKIADYDGVSLYPSSINRLCREKGLPTGMARRFDRTEERVKSKEWSGMYRFMTDIEDNITLYFKIIDSKYYFVENGKLCDEFNENDHENLLRYFKWSKNKTLDDTKHYNISYENIKKEITTEDWKSKEYSIMTIKINKVNKNQQMPIIAHKNDEKIEYKNTPPEGEIIIDSITLEDYIKFHDIEYEIIDGIYWNSYGNKIMGEVVRRLFNERVRQKKENPALANVIKLMLNSAYGKTIMKKSTTKNVMLCFSKDKFNNYLYNNFNTIKEFRVLSVKDDGNTNYEFKQICGDMSYNRGHIGCAVLSMSKRIMNEVFDVANTCNLPIYYTDTDSIHCKYDDVPILEEKYRLEYGKELNGTNLEQFHTDFNLDGAGKDEAIYSVKSVFLGKKSYMDLLESKDKDGKIINDYHIRLKGITKEGLVHTSKKYEDSYLGLYTDLSKGNKISIILNPFNIEENKKKVLFEFKKGCVFTRKEFIREVKF